MANMNLINDENFDTNHRVNSNFDKNNRRVPLSDVSNKIYKSNITQNEKFLSKEINNKRDSVHFVGNDNVLTNDDDFDILSAGSEKYIANDDNAGIISCGEISADLGIDENSIVSINSDLETGSIISGNHIEDDEQIDEIDYINSDEDDKYQCNNPLRPIYNSETKEILDYAYKKIHKPFPDLQDDDTYDVVMVVEYSEDIFKYINQLASKLAPDPYYIFEQKELKWSYRNILIDWIINVHQRFKLLPETLFLTVNLIDRFLSKKESKLSKFQLVGITALFIASKYEEINCPTLNDLVYMLDKAYTKEDVLEAEMFMINTLEFEIGWPGPLSFLRRISKADNYCFEIRTLAKYLLELTLMDPKLIGANPSWLAAGAYYLSKIILGFNNWSLAHVYYSNYTQDQVFPLATNILEICKDAENNCEAIWTKYANKKYSKVSITVDKWIKLAEEKLINQEQSSAY